MTKDNLSEHNSRTQQTRTGVLRPVWAELDVPLKDLPGGLLREEVHEVISDAITVVARPVGERGEQDGVGRVAVGDLHGVPGLQGVVPQVEEPSDLLLGDGDRLHYLLRHERGVVVRDEPLPVLVDVDKGVAGLDFGPVLEGELVDACEADSEISINSTSTVWCTR